MELNNISRLMAEKMPWVVDKNHWLISIHSSGSQPANITAPFGRIIQLQFDDIVDFEPGCVPINQDQAKVIAETIKEAELLGVKVLWVHCDAGVCRSGAIVEAGLLLGHSTDEEISKERVSNSLVFTEVRKALGFKHSFEAL